VSATVVGRNGEIIVQLRGDNSPPHTSENSFRKAYTARTLRSPSGALAERIKTDPIFGNVLHLTDIIALPGALRFPPGVRRYAFEVFRAVARLAQASLVDPLELRRPVLGQQVAPLHAATVITWRSPMILASYHP
jgi:Haem-degrading